MNANIENVMDNVRMILDGANGQYIPQKFVEGFFEEGSFANVCDSEKNMIGDLDEHDSLLEDIDNCRDSENEFYWESWDRILNDVYVFTEIHNGMDIEVYSIEISQHDGNLIGVPVELVKNLTDEEQDEFWENL